MQENLKQAISLANSIVEQGEISFADGVQARDAYDFIKPLITASTVNWKDAVAEAKVRTEESNQELVEFFKKDFDLANDVAEDKVEKGLAWVLATDNFLQALRKKK